MSARKKTDALSRTDLVLIRQTYWAFANYGGIPFLPSPRWAKRAKALADRGLLAAEASSAVPKSDWCAFVFKPTREGIAAYNASVRSRRVRRRQRS